MIIGKLKRPRPSSILEELENPTIFNNKDFGLNEELTGKNIKISIIGSGLPSHKNITSQTEDVEVFVGGKEPDDITGYSTMLSGLIVSNDKKSIKAMSFMSGLYCAKIIDNSKEASSDAIIAAILWSMIKNVDIIVLPVIVDRNIAALKEIIKKAYTDSGIIMLVPSNNGKECNVLSESPFVLPVSYSLRGKIGICKNSTNRNLIVSVIKNDIYTTYPGNKYSNASLDIISLGIATSLASLILEDNKTFNEPKEIFDILSKIINK